MNVDASGVRLGNAALTRTLASADTTRTREHFSSFLRRHGLLRAEARAFARVSHWIGGDSRTSGQPPVESREERTGAAAPNPDPGAAASTPGGAGDATPTSALAGDVNGDGAVNVLDFGRLATAYGTDDPDADLDGNGIVDEIDATILRHNFGKTAPAPEAAAAEGSVPERDTPSADLNHDGKINVLDFGRFATSYAARDGAADLYPDGEINEIDMAVFKQLFRNAT